VRCRWAVSSSAAGLTTSMASEADRASAVANANTTRVQAGNNCKPGTASTASAASSDQRNPSTTNSSAAVTPSSNHCSGGRRTTVNAAMSDNTAIRRARRQRGCRHALRKFRIKSLFSGNYRPALLHRAAPRGSAALRPSRGANRMTRATYPQFSLSTLR